MPPSLKKCYKFSRKTATECLSISKYYFFFLLILSYTIHTFLYRVRITTNVIVICRYDWYSNFLCIVCGDYVNSHPHLQIWSLKQFSMYSVLLFSLAFHLRLLNSRKTLKICFICIFQYKGSLKYNFNNYLIQRFIFSTHSW